MTLRWVLLVSADGAKLEALEACLEGSGLRVATSSNAADGAAQAADLKPALVISDSQFETAFPLMVVRPSTSLARLRKQVDDLLNPPPPPVPEPFLGGGITIVPRARRGRRWVLLINEDPALASSLEEALGGSGLHLTTVADAAQAAIQARDLRLVLIVSDHPEARILPDLRRDPAVGAVPFLGVTMPFDPVNFKERARRLLVAAGEETI